MILSLLLFMIYYINLNFRFPTADIIIDFLF